MRSYVVTFSADGDTCEVDQPAPSAIEAVRTVNRAYGHLATCADTGCACQNRTYGYIDGHPVMGPAVPTHAGAVYYQVTTEHGLFTYRARRYRVTAV